MKVLKLQILKLKIQHFLVIALLFLPQAQQVQTEEDAIRSTIAGQDPLDWLQVGDTALNEFRTEGLASKLFPTLFHFGQGDPTSSIRHHPVTLTDAFKQLIRYSDTSPAGQTR